MIITVIKKYYLLLIIILMAIIGFNLFAFFTYLHMSSKKLSDMKKVIKEKTEKLILVKNEDGRLKMNLLALKENESAMKGLIRDVFKTRSMRLTEAQTGIKGIMKNINLKNKKIAYGFSEHSGKKDEQWYRKYLKMEAGLNLIGGYGDIKKCLYEIESAPDFLEIEKMELKKTAEGGAVTEASLIIATLFENSEIGNPIPIIPEKTVLPNVPPAQSTLQPDIKRENPKDTLIQPAPPLQQNIMKPKPKSQSETVTAK